MSDIHDSVLGTLQAPDSGKGSSDRCYKVEPISWWATPSKNISLQFRRDTRTQGERITAQHRTAYTYYKKNVIKVLNEGLKLIPEYMEDHYGVRIPKSRLTKVLTPFYVLFLHDGRWAIVMEGSFDDDGPNLTIEVDGDDISIGTPSTFY